jgi:actinin alpha
MQENFVSESSGSKYTMASLRVGWETLMTSINRVINECDNQILLRDSKRITNEQLNEYRSAFANFDKERKGLDKEQLRAFLISIGSSVRAEKDDEHIQRIMHELDPNNMGRVSFNSMLDYLTKEHAESDSADQMIKAFKLLANGKVNFRVNLDSNSIAVPNNAR